MKRKTKRPITLIEIMIVIVLIGIVGGALAYNMRGSLEKGKAFKTEQTIARVKDILEFECAKGVQLSDITNNWITIVSTNPLGNGVKLTKDGWNEDLQVSVSGDSLSVTSHKLNAYYTKHPHEKNTN